MNFSSRVLFSAFLAACGPAVSANVLSDHDNGPLTGSFGIPDSTEGAVLAPRGRTQWDLSLTTSSHSISDTRQDESIILDGETTRLELSWRRGIGDRLELGVELPYLWHESGGLDSFVQSWHDLLGFPGGFRGTRPSDTIEFLYQDPSGPRIDFRRNVNGPGDVRLLAGWALQRSETSSLALRAGLKLPTGNSADLLGSGGIDTSIGLAGDYRELLGLTDLNGFFRLNAVLLGEPDLLSDIYRDVAGHASLGLGYRLTDWLELRAQGTVRTATHDSTIEVIGDPSGTMTFGGNLRIGNGYFLTIAVSEDVKVHSAPDVSFRLALRYRPQ